jgi:hypothetical protein
MELFFPVISVRRNFHLKRSGRRNIKQRVTSNQLPEAGIQDHVAATSKFRTRRML